MEHKDPMLELLNSLEQIVFRGVSQTVTLSQKTSPFIEPEQPRQETGSKTNDFARVMDVTVVTVHEWESKRVKPFTTELKLMRLIQAGPRLSKQLMD